MTLTVSSIRDFDQVRGQAQWIDGQKRRLMSVEIQFDNSGGFILNADDMAPDLVPLKGSYRVSGDRVSFDGESSYKMDVGSATLVVTGDLDVQGQLLRLSWASTWGMAANINGVGFAEATDTAWNADVDVVLRS